MREDNKPKSKLAWLDTNVILRFLIRNDESEFKAAYDIFQKAEKGHLILQVHPVTVAEMILTLDLFYQYSRKEISETLSGFFEIEGLVVLDKDLIQKALTIYGEKEVDYIDAYLAAVAGKNKEHAIVTFDVSCFSRLHPDVIVPGNSLR